VVGSRRIAELFLARHEGRVAAMSALLLANHEARALPIRDPKRSPGADQQYGRDLEGSDDLAFAADAVGPLLDGIVAARHR
jgi:hypothetical protein